MASLVGATTPLFFELGAEVTFPSNEGVSAGLISGMLNLGGLVLLVRPAPPNAFWTVEKKRRSAHSGGRCRWRWRRSRPLGMDYSSPARCWFAL
jgi:hypothetical protein